MIDLITDNKLIFFLVSSSLLSAIMLILFFFTAFYFDYTDRIEKGKDYYEHLVVGSASILLGFTIFMTDFGQGFNYWLELMLRENSSMPYQYLYWGILNGILIYHFTNQHKK